MSYGYTLALTTELSVEEVLQLVCQHLDFERHPTYAVGPAAVVHVRVSDKEDKEIGLEYEGFEPDISVSINRKRGSEDYQLVVETVIRTTTLLLHHCSGNAVLHAHDYLWLRLQNNALLINSNRALWQEYPELLPLITLPYEAVPLPDD